MKKIVKHLFRRWQFFCESVSYNMRDPWDDIHGEWAAHINKLRELK